MPTPVRITVERRFAIPLHAAYAWLTDFQDDDVRRANGAVLRQRRVIERSAGRVVYEGETEVLGRRNPATTEVALAPPDAWSARVVSGPRTGSTTAYRLTPDGAGCRIRVDYDFVLQSPVKHALLRLAKGKVRADLVRMWDGFAADMERELQVHAKPLT